MLVNDAGIELIKTFEGCRLESYQDGNGNWTIGYGHKCASERPPIDIEEASWQLQVDLQEVSRLVETLVLPLELTDNQFSALVSFAFNEGYKRLRDSYLLRCVRKKDFLAAAQEFQRWVYEGDKVSEGLRRRRKAEKELFESL